MGKWGEESMSMADIVQIGIFTLSIRQRRERLNLLCQIS